MLAISFTRNWDFYAITMDDKDMDIREQLISELKQVNSELKKDMLYERCVNKYVDGMLLMIQESWALDYKSTYLQAGEFLFNATKGKRSINHVPCATSSDVIGVGV